VIKAEIIADSTNRFGNRITTFVLTFPRIILAEFNTHRALSRNSASSRAIPYEKMVEMVKEDPFIPIRWMKEHKGMQGIEYFKDTDIMNLGRAQYMNTIEYLRTEWIRTRDDVVRHATMLNKYGLTKQMCNRLLEPFLWHTAIVTATEWENFFALRADSQAEIHIADLAQKMLDAYNESNPRLLKAGEWHIPFGNKMEEERLKPLTLDKYGSLFLESQKYKHAIQEFKVKIATARCARVSYLNFEGKDDYEADLKLHNRLKTSGHWSPFEHCAMAPHDNEERQWYGNFHGWVQYRKMFSEENKKDKRVLKKVGWTG
jgi:thymidylate synthase ThyX